MGLIPRQPTVEELGWGNSPFPIPAFSLQPFAFSLFLKSPNFGGFRGLVNLIKINSYLNSATPLIESEKMEIVSSQELLVPLRGSKK